MTKVTIVSGFLGAGKTTFIRKLIQELFIGEKLVLIENEYGEIGIDGGFLKDAGITITEMNSGCICCTLVGDFTEALRKVIKEYAPDRILIEPSGVGKLSDIVAAVEKVKDFENLSITERLVVVDAKKAKIYRKNFGEFFLDQLRYASTVILSRTQMIDEAKLAETMSMLREDNPEAPIITTPWDELSPAAIRHAFEHSDVEDLLPLPEEHHHHHHHHEDEEHDCCHGGEHHHHHEEECDDPECECHHHHHEDEEHDGCCHHDHEDEEHECCHGGEHHHHHEEECDDPECECHHHHHHHHHHGGHDADEIFDSWGEESSRKFEEAELQSILDALMEDEDYGQILRAKGIVPLSDGRWMQFDLVPDECETRVCQPDYTGRLCVIGCGLDREKLHELFRLK